MTPREVVQAFVGKINGRDVDGLCELMSDDHCFSDGLGYSRQGRDAMRKAWEGYFSMVPDYWIECERILSEGDVVAIFGRARDTFTTDGGLKPENRWEVPAAWQAVIRNDRVAEWRVYADNDPIRQIMAREQKGNGIA